MRNILIILTLCFASLASSTVFAAGYDESQRTERLGLSYYDGRPLYVVGFGREPSTGGGSLKPANCWVYRVYSGDKLSDYGTSDYMDGRKGTVYENGQAIEVVFYQYVIDDSGEPQVLTTNPAFLPGTSTSYIEYHLKNLRFTASSGDVAVDIFDAMLEPLSEMLRGWLGVVLAIGAVMFGWNFIRELWTLDFSGKSKGKNGKAPAPLSYAKLSRRDRSLYEDAALGSIGIESSQLLVPKEIKKDVDFVTGAAFGLKFDEKTRESNRLLMEMFNRLSSKEQKAILKAFRESAFDKSFEDSAEKRFLAYQGEVFDDVDNPFTGRSKRRAFDPLDAEVLLQGYGSEYVGWDAVSSADEIDDANASLDEAYYDDNGGTPF